MDRDRETIIKWHIEMKINVIEIRLDMNEKSMYVNI